jgi:hypothetical protein
MKPIYRNMLQVANMNVANYLEEKKEDADPRVMSAYNSISSILEDVEQMRQVAEHVDGLNEEIKELTAVPVAAPKRKPGPKAKPKA